VHLTLSDEAERHDVTAGCDSRIESSAALQLRGVRLSGLPRWFEPASLKRCTVENPLYGAQERQGCLGSDGVSETVGPVGPARSGEGVGTKGCLV